MEMEAKKREGKDHGGKEGIFKDFTAVLLLGLEMGYGVRSGVVFFFYIASVWFVVYNLLDYSFPSHLQ